MTYPVSSCAPHCACTCLLAAVLLLMLSARAPCSQVCLGWRLASRQITNTGHRHLCSALQKAGPSRGPATRHVTGQHNRRLTLTALLGSTVLAMGFGTSAMAASATSPTVDTVRGFNHRACCGLHACADACCCATEHTHNALQILQNPNFPETFPFGPEEFQRYDETPDTSFYSQPRFVTHIDDGAIAALTK